ncbi:hypothetical protein BGX29_001073 [Mortierella sp. GBA35]|nr:hypothetical protein BGX29_001073 [Mortierella sp. GBA35]
MKSSPRISLRALLIALTLFITFFIAATTAADDEDSPPPTTTDSSPTTTITPSPQSPPAQETAPKPTKTITSPINLPTVLYVPPVSFNINMDAPDPIFPSGSESCQKCKYFYPKLKQCNQIANQTLALLPRLPPSTTTTSFYANDTNNGATTSMVPTRTGPPSTFMTILPFLQCICPDQGLAATRVCMTCFRVSNQRNFLDQLTLQNVTSSLSAFQEACQDSLDGTIVPPPGTKGQSASAATSLLRCPVVTATMALVSLMVAFFLSV